MPANPSLPERAEKLAREMAMYALGPHSLYGDARKWTEAEVKYAEMLLAFAREVGDERATQERERMRAHLKARHKHIACECITLDEDPDYGF